MSLLYPLNCLLAPFDKHERELVVEDAYPRESELVLVLPDLELVRGIGKCADAEDSPEETAFLLCLLLLRLLPPLLVRQLPLLVHLIMLGAALGEVVGWIFSVGAKVTKFKPGLRIIADNGISCGFCFFCRHGRICCARTLRARGARSRDGSLSLSLCESCPSLLLLPASCFHLPFPSHPCPASPHPHGLRHV
ncbi:hypothetical protein CALVIDRAFT_592684 [Calocera viscosa TUFC12733]|uniref:Alcohol dehydrogenase-like N-terminal domain-containing protein n=1 Tax=Calocera viscosa (strain TUFC12733) TaxID=1330018 RepID=A0A167FZI2_CALVF|nr:hypothetical protein CALVIDRAFT_592684 [Calocera viscosa TUFC12733]